MLAVLYTVYDSPCSNARLVKQYLLVYRQQLAALHQELAVDDGRIDIAAIHGVSEQRLYLMDRLQVGLIHID